MNNEMKEHNKNFYSLEELKRTIDCYDGYLDNEEVYYFIGALRFAYDCITDLQSRNEKAREMIKFIAYNSERPLTITELNKVYNILGGDNNE